MKSYIVFPSIALLNNICVQHFVDLSDTWITHLCLSKMHANNNCVTYHGECCVR
jgi:hypothetical protein